MLERVMGDGKQLEAKKGRSLGRVHQRRSVEAGREKDSEDNAKRDGEAGDTYEGGSLRFTADMLLSGSEQSSRIPIQSKGAIGEPQEKIEHVDNGLAPEKPVQRQVEDKKAPNLTGLPDPLKEVIEGLSGFDLSGVRVNYNSPKPAKIYANAYTQGQEIEVGPGQELHLPHEAWHVVQQMQGRVRRTIEVNGVGVNAASDLEREAEDMAKKAMAEQGRDNQQLLVVNYPRPREVETKSIVQRCKLSNGIDLKKYNKKEPTEALEELENTYILGDLDDADLEKIEKKMDEMKGSTPAALKYEVKKEPDPDPDYQDLHEYNFDIPKNREMEYEVDRVHYRYYNDSDGQIDFKDPRVTEGDNKKNAAKIEYDVDINDFGFVAGTGRTVSLKQPKGYNYWHFKAANILAKTTAKGASPKKDRTWHHAKEKGRMQLIDRKVHEKFKHVGGKSKWGTV